jgi:hypothetical protein
VEPLRFVLGPVIRSACFAAGGMRKISFPFS